jgi:hypothetical protein
MARNQNIDRLLDMLPKTETIRYGARGDADMGARANLDALMGEGESIIDMEQGRNARKERLAAIRARTRGTDLAAQAAQATPPPAARALAVDQVIPPARALPPGSTSSPWSPSPAQLRRFVAAERAGMAAQPEELYGRVARSMGRADIPMGYQPGGSLMPAGGIPQQAIGPGMGGGGLSPLAGQVAGAGDDAMLALARQAGPTALGPISYSGNYGATAQTLGQLGAPARQLGQAAMSSADDALRAAAAVGGAPRVTASAATGGASSASRMAAQAAGVADDIPSAFIGRPSLGTAAGMADDVAAVAGNAGGAVGKVGKFGKLGAAAKLIGPPSLGYMGGQMVGGLVDSANIGGDNSTADRFWRNAAVGAGLGAGIGTIVPGVGNVVGGVAGGLIGGIGAGLLGIKFGDDDTVDTVGSRLSDALAQTPLDPETRAAVLAQFALQTQGQGASQARLVAEALGQQASQLILGQQQQKAQQERAMAMQAMMAPLFTPYLDMAAGSARSNTLALNNAADTLTDPDMAAIYRARAANLENMAMQGVAGYAAQMQNPQMARDLALLGQYGSRVDSSILGTLAGQTAQGALGTGQGGQQSFADILANAQRVG